MLSVDTVPSFIGEILREWCILNSDNKETAGNFPQEDAPVRVSGILRKAAVPYGRYCDNAIQLNRSGLGYLMAYPGFALINSAGQFSVFYNEQQPERECRFTLAHELGHILLGHLKREESGNDKIEAEANEFARHLLLRDVGDEI